MTTIVRVAVAIVEHDGRVIVGRRPAGAALAGKWEFPGGKIRPGETSAEAAIRETREETGIEVTVVSAYGSRQHAYAHDTVAIEFFRCQPVDAGQQPADPYQWFPIGDLPSLEFPAANSAVIARLVADAGSEASGSGARRGG